MIVAKSPVRICTEVGSFVVSWSEYLEWGKMTKFGRSHYVNLRKWGYDHQDAMQMGEDPYE